MLCLLHLLQDSLYVKVSNAMCTYRQRTWQGAAAIHTMMIMIYQISFPQCVTYIHLVRTTAELKKI